MEIATKAAENAKSRQTQTRRQKKRRKSADTRELALRELLGATRLAQTDLLTLDFARIARDETGLGQLRLQPCIIIDQGARNAVTNSARLTGITAAADIDHDVEAIYDIGQFQRLTDHHQSGLARKILACRLSVDNDLAGAGFDENTSHCTLATAGSVIVVTDHVYSLEFECFGLLGSVRMSSIGIHFELFDHGVTERPFWQHAFDRLFERTPRKTLLHFLEIGFVNPARIAGMAEILFIGFLRARHTQLSCIDDDDEIARIDVRSKFRFVLAAQSECHFAGNTSEDFVRRVNHEPVALDLVAFGGKGFHDDFLVRLFAQMLAVPLPASPAIRGLDLVISS